MNALSRILVALLLWAAIFAVSSSAWAAKPFRGSEIPRDHAITAEDVLTIRELSEVKLSPDGKQPYGGRRTVVG